ncbi:hypothetical protein TNCV_5043031 [Trichonephila clavipes]|nr:hypothetical protein TNCV_5043031 [Trichonephila clavipes]
MPDRLHLNTLSKIRLGALNMTLQENLKILRYATIQNRCRQPMWYWDRTRDQASHDPIPIPLGYRGHMKLVEQAPLERVAATSNSPGVARYENPESGTVVTHIGASVDRRPRIIDTDNTVVATPLLQNFGKQTLQNTENICKITYDKLTAILNCCMSLVKRFKC